MCQSWIPQPHPSRRGLESMSFIAIVRCVTAVDDSVGKVNLVASARLSRENLAEFALRADRIGLSGGHGRTNMWGLSLRSLAVANIRLDWRRQQEDTYCLVYYLVYYFEEVVLEFVGLEPTGWLRLFRSLIALFGWGQATLFARECGTCRKSSRWRDPVGLLVSLESRARLDSTKDRENRGWLLEKHDAASSWDEFMGLARRTGFWNSLSYLRYCRRVTSKH